MLTTATTKDSTESRSINYATTFSKLLNTTITAAFGNESYENIFSILGENEQRFDVAIRRTSGSNNNLDELVTINYRAWGIA